MLFARGCFLSLACLALTVIVLVAVAGMSTPAARADACPGSGASRVCPYTSVTTIGRRAEGVLRFPEAVAVDAAGNVYVADQLSYVVQKFSNAGVLEGEWGSYGGGHGQFGPIGGIAVDPAGNVYVVDSSHNRIQKFDPNGNFITSWGHHGSELGQFSFGSSQNYTQPPGGGIAATSTHVYVADSANNRIERFNLSGGEAMQWGTKGSDLGQFSYPRGVAANDGEVIVADDDNHRVQKFDPDGAFQAVAGSHGKGPLQFGFPYGVALDAAGNVYVADDLNHRVVKLTPQLTFAGAWGGFGSKPGQLAFPRALASDGAGSTYVANTANDRIEVFDTSGNYLRTLGISARGVGQLTAPRGLAVDPTGGLLVSDTVGNRVELFAPATLGLGYLGQWTQTGGSHTGFDEPTRLTVDPLGSVYVADRGNARIVRLWGDGTFLDDMSATITSGGASLRATDPAGRTYVLEPNNNRVEVFDPEGRMQAKWGLRGIAPGYFSQPAAIALGCDGAVYVADTNNNRVERFSLASPAVVPPCLAAGSWPPPLDVAPVLRVTLPRSYGILARRALALTLSCQRGCKILATATLSPLGKRRRRVGLIASARGLPAASTGHVRLRVSPSGLHRLRRALGRRRTMSARVSILAVGPTGRRTRLTKIYTVRR